MVICLWTIQHNSLVSILLGNLLKQLIYSHYRPTCLYSGLRPHGSGRGSGTRFPHMSLGGQIIGVTIPSVVSNTTESLRCRSACILGANEHFLFIFIACVWVPAAVMASVSPSSEQDIDRDLLTRCLVEEVLGEIPDVSGCDEVSMTSARLPVMLDVFGSVPLSIKGLLYDVS